MMKNSSSQLLLAPLPPTQDRTSFYAPGLWLKALEAARDEKRKLEFKATA